MAIDPTFPGRPTVQQLRPRLPPSIMPPMPEIMPPVDNQGEQARTTSLTRAMWDGYNPIIPRVATRAQIERPLYQVPTMEREPESKPPPIPIWVNSNWPPWVNPPSWSVPVDLTYTRCIPFYEQAQLMHLNGNAAFPSFVVPQDYTLVIKKISYEALNSVQDDVFQFDFLIDGNPRMSIEDINIDAAQPNPAHQYGLAGHTRQMPVHLVVDRNHTLAIRAILRGPIDFAGNSPYFPGQPIVSTNCEMRVYLQGWMANLRENVDGAPRPTDLGDADGLILTDTQQDGGSP